MHLAVCDDNIADRKQTERLLGRQSDRIFKDCGERLYIDSYGNVEAFMQKPQMYHGLFIDMVSDPECTGFDVLKMLLDANIVRPIIMCSSSIDYRALVEQAGIHADNIYYLDKPIRVADLTAMIDKLKSLCGNTIPTIELRGQNETIYARGDDIICVKRAKAELEVFLTGNRTVNVIDDIINFYDQCTVFPQICPINDNALININHIKKKSFGKVTMDNDVSLSISFTYRHAIEQTKEYRNESDGLRQ